MCVLYNSIHFCCFLKLLKRKILFLTPFLFLFSFLIFAVKEAAWYLFRRQNKTKRVPYFHFIPLIFHLLHPLMWVRSLTFVCSCAIFNHTKWNMFSNVITCFFLTSLQKRKGVGERGKWQKKETDMNLFVKNQLFSRNLYFCFSLNKIM